MAMDGGGRLWTAGNFQPGKRTAIAVVGHLNGGRMSTTKSLSLLLTPEEVADELRISRSQVYALMERRIIPSIQIERSRRIPRADLERWIRQRVKVAVDAAQPARAEA
jgi:excisionase family DNA binding protein